MFFHDIHTFIASPVHFKIDRELCRYMKYKEKEAIKESVDMLNKYKQKKIDEE